MKLLSNWWHALLKRHAAAKTRKELHRLSDHLLKDLGLRRTEIDALYR